MMLSKAIEPHRSMRIVLILMHQPWKRWCGPHLRIEQIQTIAGWLESRRLDENLYSELAVGGKSAFDLRGPAEIITHHENTPGDRQVACVCQGELERWKLLRKCCSIPERRRQDHNARTRAVRLQVRCFDAQLLDTSGKRDVAADPAACRDEKRLGIRPEKRNL